MAIFHAYWRRNRQLAAALACAICLGLANSLGSSARSEGAPGGPAPGDLTHALQGLKFVGPLDLDGETIAADEVLTFKDGRFSSSACREFGFAPASYWVRRGADGLRFLAELQSAENGTIRFEGVFDGSELQATALWTKERWYWTIEQKLVFTSRSFEQVE